MRNSPQLYKKKGGGGSSQTLYSIFRQSGSAGVWLNQECCWLLCKLVALTSCFDTEWNHVFKAILPELYQKLHACKSYLKLHNLLAI